MNYNRIIRSNEKQFAASLKREGQTILNYNKNIEELVLFNKIKNSRSAQDKLSIYYSVSTSIKKGDVLFFKGEYYIVLNENYPENEVWRNSTLMKCNTTWNLFGKVVPLVASELSSPSPNSGSAGIAVNSIGGAVNFYTSDIELLHTNVGLNDVFYDFGGTYKLINKFFVDGLAYIYLQRDRTISATMFEMYYTGNYQYKISNGSVPLLFTVGKYATSAAESNYYVPTAKIKYSVNNPEIATVDENGIMAMHQTGEITITATSTGYIENGAAVDSSDHYNLSKTVTIRIVEELSNFLELSAGNTNFYIRSTNGKFIDVYEFDGNLDEVEITERPTYSCQFIDETTGEVMEDDANDYIIDRWKDTAPISQLRIGMEENATTMKYLGHKLRIDVTTSSGATGFIVLTIYLSV